MSPDLTLVSLEKLRDKAVVVPSSVLVVLGLATTRLFIGKTSTLWLCPNPHRRLPLGYSGISWSVGAVAWSSA